ncbi:hypothetical protein C2845_PM09G04260 [Panicum miliaceum]|uniref:Uncharacterized protein n=1 Tax=Panicum miliaceum TaxID=4540 RepID=A0A3L6S208_PANMI|nr:hypothetical protein C2845_PM09G04260 [Panicum miliaceum]
MVDALATFGCFDAHYPALSPDLRATLFDGTVRALFVLPADAKRRNSYGPDKLLYGSSQAVEFIRLLWSSGAF